jgi:peptidoglycan hydrolase CwlO-like protein
MLQDSKAIRSDDEKIRADRQALAEAEKSGDKAKIEEARKNLRSDIRERRGDMRQLREDERQRYEDLRNLRADHRERRQDRRELRKHKAAGTQQHAAPAKKSAKQ